MHGGGWIRGKPEDIRGYSHYFATQGFVCLRPQYRLVGEGGNVEETLADLRDALAWARQSADRFRAGSPKFIMGGSSAGAHLAALLAQGADDCVGLIGFSGLYDIVHKGEGTFGRNAGFLRGSTAADWERGSPIYRLRQPAVPTLLLHGEQDAAVDRLQATRFAEAIRSRGGRSEACIYPAMAHSIPLTSEVEEKLLGFIGEISADALNASVTQHGRSAP